MKVATSVQEERALSNRPAYRHSRRIGILLVLLSSLAFGSMPIFARLAYAAGAGVTTVLLARFGIGAVILGAIAAGRRTPLPRGHSLCRLVALGALCYVVQATTMFQALRFTSAGTVQMVIYTYPSFVAILSAVFLGERITRRRGMAIGMALVGTTLAVGSVTGARLIGVVLALCSAFLYALYVIGASRVAGKAGALASTTVIVSSAAVAFAVIVGVQGPQWPGTALGWAALVALAVVSTVIAALSFLAGSRRVGPVMACTVSTVEPLFTIGLAALVLNERMGLPQFAGGALILVAVLMIARK